MDKQETKKKQGVGVGAGTCVDPLWSPVSGAPMEESVGSTKSHGSSKRSTPLTPEEIQLLSDSNPFKQDIAQKYGLAFPDITTQSQEQHRKKSMNMLHQAKHVEENVETTRKRSSPFGANEAMGSSKGKYGDTGDLSVFDEEAAKVARERAALSDTKVVSSSGRFWTDGFYNTPPQSAVQESRSISKKSSSKTKQIAVDDDDEELSPTKYDIVYSGKDGIFLENLPTDSTVLNRELEEKYSGIFRFGHKLKRGNSITLWEPDADFDDETGYPTTKAKTSSSSEEIRNLTRSYDKRHERRTSDTSGLSSYRNARTEWGAGPAREKEISASKQEAVPEVRSKRGTTDLEFVPKVTSPSQVGNKTESENRDVDNIDLYSAIRAEDVQRKHILSKTDYDPRKTLSEGEGSRTRIESNNDSLEFRHLSTHSFEESDVVSHKNNQGGLRVRNARVTADSENVIPLNSGSGVVSSAKISEGHRDILCEFPDPFENEILNVELSAGHPHISTVLSATDSTEENIKRRFDNVYSRGQIRRQDDLVTFDDETPVNVHTQSQGDEFSPDSDILQTAETDVSSAVKQAGNVEGSIDSSFYDTFGATVDEDENGVSVTPRQDSDTNGAAKSSPEFPDVFSGNNGRSYVTKGQRSGQSTGSDISDPFMTTTCISKDILFNKQFDTSTNTDTSSISCSSMKVNLSEDSSTTDQFDTDLLGFEPTLNETTNSVSQKPFDLMVPFNPLTDCLSNDSIAVNVSNESIHSVSSNKSHGNIETNRVQEKPNKTSLLIEIGRRNIMLEPGRRSSVPLVEQSSNSSGQSKFGLVSTHSLDTEADAGTRRSSLASDVTSREPITTFKSSQGKLQYEDTQPSTFSSFKSFGKPTSPPGGDQAGGLLRKSNIHAPVDTSVAVDSRSSHQRSLTTASPLIGSETGASNMGDNQTTAPSSSDSHQPATDKRPSQFANFVMTQIQKPLRAMALFTTGHEPQTHSRTNMDTQQASHSQSEKAERKEAKSSDEHAHHKREKETSPSFRQALLGSKHQVDKNDLPGSTGFLNKEANHQSNITLPPDLVPYEEMHIEPLQSLPEVKSEVALVENVETNEKAKVVDPWGIVVESKIARQDSLKKFGSSEEDSFFMESDKLEEKAPSVEDNEKSIDDSSKSITTTDSDNQDNSVVERKISQDSSSDSDGGDIDSIVKEFKQEGSSDEGDIDDLVEEFKQSDQYEPPASDSEESKHHGLAFMKFGKVLRKVQSVTRYIHKSDPKDPMAKLTEGSRRSAHSSRSHSPEHFHEEEIVQTDTEHKADDDAFELLSKAAEVFKAQTVKKKRPVEAIRRTKTQVDTDIDEDEDLEQYDLVTRAAKLFKGFKAKKGKDEIRPFPFMKPKQLSSVDSKVNVEKSNILDSTDSTQQFIDDMKETDQTVEAKQEPELFKADFEDHFSSKTKTVSDKENAEFDHEFTAPKNGQTIATALIHGSANDIVEYLPEHVSTGMDSSDHEIPSPLLTKEDVMSDSSEKHSDVTTPPTDLRKDSLIASDISTQASDQTTPETRHEMSVTDSGCGSELDNMSSRTDLFFFETDMAQSATGIRLDELAEERKAGLPIEKTEGLVISDVSKVLTTGKSEEPMDQEMHHRREESDIVDKKKSMTVGTERESATLVKANSLPKSEGSLESPKVMEKPGKTPCDLVLSTGLDEVKTSKFIAKDEKLITKAGKTDAREETNGKLEELAKGISAVDEAGFVATAEQMKAEGLGVEKPDYIRLSSDSTEAPDCRSLTVNFPESPDNGFSLDGDRVCPSLCCGGNMKKVQLNCTAMMKKPERRPSAVVIANKRLVITEEEKLGLFPTPPAVTTKDREFDENEYNRLSGDSHYAEPKALEPVKKPDNTEVLKEIREKQAPLKKTALDLVSQHERNRNFAGSREELLDSEEKGVKNGKFSKTIHETKEMKIPDEAKTNEPSEEPEKARKRGSIVDEFEADKNAINMYVSVINELATKQAGRSQDGKEKEEKPVDRDQLEAKSKRYGRVISETELSGELHTVQVKTQEQLRAEHEKIEQKMVEKAGENTEVEKPVVEVLGRQCKIMPSRKMTESIDVYDNMFPETPAPPLPERLHGVRPKGNGSNQPKTTDSWSSIVSDGAADIYSQGHRTLPNSIKHQTGKTKWVSSTPHLSNIERTSDVASGPRTGSFPILPRTESELSSVPYTQPSLGVSAGSLGSGSGGWGNYAKIDDFQDRRSYDSESSSGLVIPGGGRASTLSDVSDTCIFGEYATVKDDLRCQENPGIIRPLDSAQNQREQEFRFKHFPPPNGESHYVNIPPITSQPTSSSAVGYRPLPPVRGSSMAEGIRGDPIAYNHYATIGHAPPHVSKSVQFPDSNLRVVNAKVSSASQTSLESLMGYIRDDASDILEGLPVFEYTLGATQGSHASLSRRSLDTQSLGQYSDTLRPDVARQTASLDRRYVGNNRAAVDRTTPRKKPTRVTFSRDEVLTEVIQGIQKSETPRDDSERLPNNGRGLRDYATSTLSSLGGGVKEIAKALHVPFQCCRRPIKEPVR